MLNNRDKPGDPVFTLRTRTKNQIDICLAFFVDGHFPLTCGAKISVYKQLKNSRGKYRPGIYSAGAHVLHGYQTWATPDGRSNGQPISDSASPSHGVIKNGPTGVARSVLALNPSNFGNGLQFNMKFHPSSIEGQEGTEKMKQFIRAFFDRGGTQLQYNVVDAETLKQAQENPDDHRDLVVRVAGFSAYFVELYEDLQNEIITRSEINL